LRRGGIIALLPPQLRAGRSPSLTILALIPLPERFPDESGWYTHAIGKSLHVSSRQMERLKSFRLERE
jgi:hypothetical protein